MRYEPGSSRHILWAPRPVACARNRNLMGKSLRPQAPCLSLWERCPRRGRRGPSQSAPLTALPEGEPRCFREFDCPPSPNFPQRCVKSMVTFPAMPGNQIASFIQLPMKEKISSRLISFRISWRHRGKIRWVTSSIPALRNSSAARRTPFP